MIEVTYPYTGEVIATVPKASLDDVRRAYRIARDYQPTLTHYERYKILMRAGEIIASRLDEISRTITLESGLCRKDSLYEVGRASDVLLFAANQALVDDGQVFRTAIPDLAACAGGCFVFRRRWRTRRFWSSLGRHAEAAARTIRARRGTANRP